VRPESIRRHAAQRRFLDCEARYTWVEAAPKTGKTVGCLVWLFEQALRGGPGQHYWWVAPVQAQAAIAYRRLLRFVRPQGFARGYETDMRIVLQNGATIWFRSGQLPDNLYGEDVYAAVVDEASRMAEPSWHALRSTLTYTEGPVKLIGNVRGTRNWFYEGCRQAEAGLEGHAYHCLTIQDGIDAGLLSQAELDDLRRTLPDPVFRELYYCEPWAGTQNAFAYHFDAQRHVSAEAEYRPEAPVYLSFDFNVAPMVCAVFQHGIGPQEPPARPLHNMPTAHPYAPRPPALTPAQAALQHGWIHQIDEFWLRPGDLHRLCHAIREKYPRAQFIVTGDAAGQARSALVPGAAHAYQLIRHALGLEAFGALRVPSHNPDLFGSRLLLNGILAHHPHFKIHPRCHHTLADLQYVQSTRDGKIDKASDPNLSHLLDAVRYYLHVFHQLWIKAPAATTGEGY
jgi:hypothetical protein